MVLVDLTHEIIALAIATEKVHCFSVFTTINSLLPRDVFLDVIDQ